MRESGKPDPHEEKYTTTKVQGQMQPKHVSWENLTHIRYDGGTRLNVLETHELRKPNLCEEKFATAEIQNQMCSRHVSWENPTRVMKNML